MTDAKTLTEMVNMLESVDAQEGDKYNELIVALDRAVTARARRQTIGTLRSVLEGSTKGPWDLMPPQMARVRDAMQRAAQKNTRGTVFVTEGDVRSLLFELRNEGILLIDAGEEGA